MAITGFSSKSSGVYIISTWTVDDLFCQMEKKNLLQIAFDAKYNLPTKSIKYMMHLITKCVDEYFILH